VRRAQVHCAPRTCTRTPTHDPRMQQ
jgi:hypothetical protein